MRGVVATYVNAFFSSYIVPFSVSTTIAGTVGCSDIDPNRTVSRNGVLPPPMTSVFDVPPDTTFALLQWVPWH
jgi:hypothetical protein